MANGYIANLFKKSSLYSAGNIFQQIVNFFLIPVYTAFLSTEDYGIIGLMSMTAGIILQITKTPVAHGFVRYYFEKDFIAKRGELLFSSIIYALLNSFLFFIVFYNFDVFFAEVILDSHTYTNIILIYSFIILLQPLEDISQDLIKTQKKAGLYLIHQIILIISSASIILFMLNNNYGVMSIIWGNLYISIFPFVFFFPVIIKSIKFKFNFKALIPLLKYGYPMIPASISVVLLQMIDHYILKYFYDVSTVGLYTFGYKFGGLIGFLIIIPVQNILHPMILELEKDKKELLDFFSKSLHYIFYISLLGCLVLSLFAKEVIYLMAQNKDFYPAWQFIPIIAFAYVMYGLSEILGKGILLSKRTVFMSFTVVSAAIVNIILNIILIPLYNVFGAAFATLLSFIYLSVINYYYSNKLYKIKIKFGKILTSSVLMLILISLSYFINFDNILYNIILKLIIIISFIFAIFVMIDRKDFINILRTIKK